MTAYRKLIAAIVGVAALLLHRHLGLDLTGVEPVVVDLVIGALTAAGVWGAPNDLPPPRRETPPRSRSPGDGPPRSAGLALLLAAVLVAGCGAVQKAEMPAQHAFALYGTFVAAQEAAADIVENPATPDSAVRAIAGAEALAHPLAKALQRAAREYQTLADRVAAIEASGADPPQALLEKAQAALAALQRALTRARPAIEAFADRVGAAA